MLTSIDINLKPLIKKLEIHSNKNVFGELTGEYSTFFKGRGLDFDGYRQYQTSDDASKIDWKASLRSQDLLVKEYSEERNVDVFIVLDTSASMCFASQKKLKCEYAAEVAASLAFGGIQTGDKIGLIIFNESIKVYLSPQQGTKQFGKITAVLSDPRNYDGKRNYYELVNGLNSFVKKSGVVIFISDFISFPPNWDKKISGILENTEFFAVMIRDPRDDYLPRDIGELVVSDPYSDQIAMINTRKIALKFNEVALQIKAEVISKIKLLGGSFIELKTNEPFDVKLSAFFSRANR